MTLSEYSTGRGRSSLVALGGCLLLLAGCGDGDTGPATVPVSGTLTLNGTPVEGAEVTFVHEEFAAFATTDSEGRYELVPGAVVGENKVVVSKWEGGPEMGGGEEDDGIDAEQMRMMAETGGAGMPKQLMPEEHSREATTGLSFEVPEGGSDAADFDL